MDCFGLAQLAQQLREHTCIADSLRWALVIRQCISGWHPENTLSMVLQDPRRPEGLTNPLRQIGSRSLSIQAAQYLIICAERAS
jgi:hypothetical protein